MSDGRRIWKYVVRSESAAGRCEMGFKGRNGWGGINLKEPQVARVDYEVTWMKPKIDLRELAKLRESDLSLREIANRLGTHKSTLHRYLNRLKQR